MIETDENYFIVNPSFRRQILCFSITSAHSSSPFLTTQSSLRAFVSGQEQHIFLPDMPSTGCDAGGVGVGVDGELPMWGYIAFSF